MCELAAEGQVYVPQYNSTRLRLREKELIEENGGSVEQVKVSAEDRRYYEFNQDTDVKQIVADIQAEGVKLPNGYIFESDYEFLSSKRCIAFTNATDRHTIYKNFSVDVNNGRDGVKIINQSFVQKDLDFDNFVK